MILLLLAMWVPIITATCDPAIVETRGLSGLWLAADWQNSICELDAMAGIEWADCLDAEARYFPCMVRSYVECIGEVCTSYEYYVCPFVHHGISPLKYYDFPAGSTQEFHVYVRGVCGEAGTNPVVATPWPDACVGTTQADFRGCFE